MYSDIIRRYRQDDRLQAVLLELTYDCNLDCWYCYNDKNRQGSPLALEDYKRVLTDLSEMGVLGLTLSGGEPLLHPDFFAIGRFARELGFVVRLKTNGNLLNEDIVGRIQDEIDPFGVDVSLHGATARVHERQTRRPGTFDDLLDHIRLMVNGGLRVTCNSVITKWNQIELAEMEALCAEMGVIFRSTFSVTPRDDGDMNPLGILASKDVIRKKVLSGYEKDSSKAERKEKKPAPKMCGIGSTTAVIDPFGDVLPCVDWREPAGNIREKGIQEIWENSTVLKSVRAISEEQAKRLEEGAPWKCIAQAKRQTGDPYSTYPEIDFLNSIKPPIDR